MPWCPVCKCEYREGITNCFDCRVPLVDSLEDIDEMPDTQNADDIGYSYDDNSELTGFDAESVNEDYENYADDYDVNLSEEDTVRSGSFVKKSEQYQEYLFSAYTCIIVGLAGIIFGILNVAGIFEFVSVTFTQIVLLAIFILFFAGGIAMYVKSRSIKSQIGIENKKIDAINEWLSENIDTNTLKSIKDPEVSDEINYFNYCEKVKEQLLFSIPDADSAMADSLVDEYINGLLS